MTQDATFEDGRETPLNLSAQDDDDLQVIAALTQDSVFPMTEMRWLPQQRRFALLLNRFRWEDDTRARHAPERVQSILVVDNVLQVASQGIDRQAADMILSLLSLTFEPGDDGAGELLLTLAGDGAIRLSTEALDVTLKDVTRPYRAPSGKVPEHPV
ncbi:DUF2948 family protein [Rhodobacteraceae bacterium F11138]|nr:DUF2948 family protein [Rhodobacteraceae bacterium F11138]